MKLWSKVTALDRLSREEDGAQPSLSLLLIVGLVALVVVPAIAVLLFQTVRSESRDNRARALLARDGTVTEGTVIGRREPHRSVVLPDAVRVEFVTGTGETIRTWMPVSDRLEKGAQVRISYSNSDPEVARLVGDETPYRGRWKMVAIGGPAFSLVLILLVVLSERLRQQRPA